MATKVEQRTYDEAVQWLRDHGFDLIDAPGTTGRVFLKKYNCSAAIQKDGDEGTKIFAYPGYLINGEISKLINRGYQQVLKTSKTEVAATADHLKALARIARLLRDQDVAKKLRASRDAQAIYSVLALPPASAA